MDYSSDSEEDNVSVRGVRVVMRLGESSDSSDTDSDIAASTHTRVLRPLVYESDVSISINWLLPFINYYK